MFLKKSNHYQNSQENESYFFDFFLKKVWSLKIAILILKSDRIN